MSDVLPNNILAIARRIFLNQTFEVCDYIAYAGFGDLYVDINHQSLLLRISRERSVWNILAGTDGKNLYDMDLWASYLDGNRSDIFMNIDDQILYISNNIDRVLSAIDTGRDLSSSMSRLKSDRAKERFPRLFPQE